MTGFSRTERLRQPEVEHLDRAVLASLDVGRLQIAVNDPVLVRRLERFRNLPPNRERFAQGNRALRDAVGKRRALDQLEDQGAYGVSGFSWTFLQAVNATDIRMIERGERLRLALEAGDATGIVRKRLWKDLDRHVAIELRVRARDRLHPCRPARAARALRRPRAACPS